MQILNPILVKLQDTNWKLRNKLLKIQKDYLMLKAFFHLGNPFKFEDSTLKLNIKSKLFYRIYLINSDLICFIMMIDNKLNKLIGSR